MAVSRGDLFLMISEFACSNSIPETAKINLYKLINSMFPIKVLPDSQYTHDKLMNPNEGNEFHAVCPGCTLYIGQFGKIPSVFDCPNCQKKTNLTKICETSFYWLTDPSKQISDLLNIYQKDYMSIIRDRIPSDEYLQDIFDGKLYRKFQNSLPPETRYRYVSGCMNTDGAKKFDSSKSSIDPIYLMLNELPPHIRTKKLITCGLWYNKKKPEMAAFVDKFVDILNRLETEGIKCEIENEEKIIKLFVVTACLDSVARAPLQGTMQFNGAYGCSWCLHPGFHAEGSMRYPLIEENIPFRNHEDTVEAMINYTPGSNFLGIKYPSPMINVLMFDLVEGFVTDYLHAVLEGAVRQMLKHQLQVLTEEQLKKLDEKMLKIKVPKQIGRLSKKLSEWKDWSAADLENWCLYYSIPILSTFLPETELEHWVLLVESLYILLKDKIHITELDAADKKLLIFVGQLEDICKNKACMTINIHILTHIPTAVLNWGPLWATSTFAFETANRYSLQAIHSARGVNLQIARYVHFRHHLLIIEEKIKPTANRAVLQFCDETLARKAKSVDKMNQITYFGVYDDLDCSLSSYLEKAYPKHVSRDSKLYYKIVKNGCLYDSYFREKERSDNSVCKLKNGDYFKILYFILDEKYRHELTIGHYVHTRRKFSTMHTAFREITNIDQSKLEVIKTETIERICVFTEEPEIKFLCQIPNQSHNR